LVFWGGVDSPVDFVFFLWYSDKMKKILKFSVIWLVIFVFLWHFGYFLWLKTSLFSLPDLSKKPVAEASTECDVAVAGGGIGGTMAAISAARSGVEVCLFSETDWLGGMLTSAGVSGIDGLKKNLHGIFAEFVERVQKKYEGSGENLGFCTVSYLCFEPKIGHEVLQEMVSEESNIRLFYEAKFEKVFREQNRILGFRVRLGEGVSVSVRAQVTVDATDFGDLMELGRIPYDIGPDLGSTESLAEEAEACIQPITHIGIVKFFDSPQRIPKPENYRESDFLCSIPNEKCPQSSTRFTLDRTENYGLFKYAALPGGKFLLNIPSHSFGNDFHASAPAWESSSREAVIAAAKNHTLGYLYYLQTVHGLENLGLTDDFGTDDGLAKIPYVRESRRLRGVRRLVESDVVSQKMGDEPTSIATGSYPIDLHFCRTGIGDVYERVSPYQIPYEILIPQKIDGFLVGTGRTASVSRIVNGTTRLQQVESYIGQAAGVAASLAVREGVNLREISVSRIQNQLLRQNARIVFVENLSPEKELFRVIQKFFVKSTKRMLPIPHGVSQWHRNYFRQQLLRIFGDEASGS